MDLVANLPSLFPINKDSLKKHLDFLGYVNLPEMILDDFTEELLKLERALDLSGGVASKVATATSNSSSPKSYPIQSLCETKVYKVVKRPASSAEFPTKNTNTLITSGGNKNGNPALNSMKSNFPKRPASVATSTLQNPGYPSSSSTSQQPRNEQVVSVARTRRPSYSHNSASVVIPSMSKVKKSDPVSLFKFHCKDWKKQPYVRLQKGSQ